MCGEYSLLAMISYRRAGSPPHVWRILHQTKKRLLALRITSTCVENTKGQSKKNTQTLGSPPHVWRIHNQKNPISTIVRITSTCVENTFSAVINFKTIRDHLHMCGEYQSSVNGCDVFLGSPPHVWRIHHKSSINESKIRITSTCVENTVNKSLYSAK